MAGIKNTSYQGFNAASSSNSGPTSGWMLWSGSFELKDSSPTTSYSGVGIEAIAGSESYFRFRSDDGGDLDVRANKFFIGNPKLQFMSGSASDIEISGSGFHIRPLSNGETEITASAGKIGNWIIKDGKLSGSNATLDAVGAALYMSNKGPDTDSSAAFDILRDEYYIDFTPDDQGNTTDYFVKFGPNFAVDKSGSLHASGAVFQGTITTSAARIGDWHVGTNNISSSGGNIVLNGSTSPEIKVTGPSAQHTVKMKYSSDTNYGIIGVSGSGTKVFELGSTNQIAGWTFTNDKLSSNNLEIKSSGELKTADFTSSNLPGSAGRGWRIKASGEAEFENASIRGTLNTAVFEKQSVNVVGGQLLVSNGTTITGSSIILASTTTIPVKNADGFVANEYIISKATGSTGFTTETMKITGVDSTSEPNTLTVSRNQDGAGTIPSMSAGQVLASAGVSGSGYIHLNAAPSDAATPYIDIIERTGSNAASVKRRARLGDLSGVAGEGPVPADPGFGLYSENVYLSGTITASAGKIGGWNINSNTLNDVNNKVKLDASGLYPFSSSAFQVDSEGAITASAGKIAGFTVDATQIKSVPDAGGGYLQMLADATPDNRFLVTPDGDLSGGSGNLVMMFNYNSGTWGLQGTKNGDEFFQLGSTNQIAGWTFDNSELRQAKVTMSSAGKITVGNPGAQRIELDGTNASMSFFDGSGNTVMTLDDNIDGVVPGISMTEGTIVITGSTDYGAGATYASPGFSTVMTNVTAGGVPGIADSRVGAMFALSDGATVNTDYTDFTTTFVDSCGTKGGGGGASCYDVGAIVGSVHNAQATVGMVSGYGHDAYGIMSRAIVADPSKNQQYSFFGEHGNLVNSQSACIGSLDGLKSTMLTVHEPTGGADKGISLTAGDSDSIWVHFMNSTTSTTPNTDGWKIGMDSSERFQIYSEERNKTLFMIDDSDGEIYLGDKVTIGDDSVGTATTLPMFFEDTDLSNGASCLLVKASTNAEVSLIGAMGHNHEGGGVLFVGQSSDVGGGIGFDGGSSHVYEINHWSQDAVVLFRTDYNDVTNHDVMWWQYNSNNVSVRGSLTDGVSDKRVKTNVKVIPNALDKILKVRGVTFDYNENAKEMGYLSTSDWEDKKKRDNHVGVIAQEIQKVLPEAVSPAPIDIDGKKGGYLTVQYDKLTALLIEGIKEQQGQIEELKNEIKEIKKCLPGT